MKGTADSGRRAERAAGRNRGIAARRAFPRRVRALRRQAAIEPLDARTRLPLTLTLSRKGRGKLLFRAEH